MYYLSSDSINEEGFNDIRASLNVSKFLIILFNSLLISHNHKLVSFGKFLAHLAKAKLN